MTPEQKVRMVNNFLMYHKANPGIYRLFDRFAQRVVQAGRLRYSSWAIANAIRWHSDIVVRTKDFKLSNNFIGAYARLWRQKNRKHASLIAVRRSMWDDIDLKTLVG